MLKKIIPIAFAAAAMLLPAAPAAAWEQVCMKFPFGKAWYAGYLVVVHGFIPHSLPTMVLLSGTLVHGKKERLKPGIGTNRNNRAIAGRENIAVGGKIVSGRIHAAQTRCVDISEIPEGDPFIVYVDTAETGPDGAAHLCETHSSNPNGWYLQTNRPYRTLHYDAWGASWAPRCKFTHEYN